jgi:hypothetical protein
LHWHKNNETLSVELVSLVGGDGSVDRWIVNASNYEDKPESFRERHSDGAELQDIVLSWAKENDWEPGTVEKLLKPALYA